MSARDPPPDPPEGPLGAFLLEVDPAVVAAGLVPELAQAADGLALVGSDGRRLLATAASPPPTSFVRSWSVADRFTGPVHAVGDRLRRVGAGDVRLHINIPPDEYAPLMRELRSGLGDGPTAHLFQVADAWVIGWPERHAISTRS